ncbi:MAG: phospholipase D-like domain-containing protein, partial [Opitutales bacterium]
MNVTAPSSIRDNNSRGRAGDFLREDLQPDTDLSVVSAFFTLHAYHAIKTQLDQIRSLRFLFGDPQFVNNLEKDAKASREFQITESGLSLGNQLSQGKLARECADWLKSKAEIRTVRQSGLLHGKLYHLRNGPVAKAMLGSSNFTVPGLGLRESGNNVELNIVVDSDRERNDLHAWFTEWWSDEALTRDAKEEVLRELARLYSNQAPQFIYYLTLFHIFREYIEGERGAETDLKNLALPDTRVWK